MILMMCAVLAMLMLGMAGVRYFPLVDAALAIQAAVTKAASFDGPALSMGTGYAPGGLGQALAAAVTVTAVKTSVADETYSLKLQQSSDGAAWEDIGVGVLVTAAGVVVVKGLCTKANLRLALTAGGTLPSITYSALIGF